jgi:hypothetical protein
VQRGIATRAVFADPPSGAEHEFIRRGLPYDSEEATRVHRLRWLGVTDIVEIPAPVAEAGSQPLVGNPRGNPDGNRRASKADARGHPAPNVSLTRAFEDRPSALWHRPGLDHCLRSIGEIAMVGKPAPCRTSVSSVSTTTDASSAKVEVRNSTHCASHPHSSCPLG